MAMAIIPKGTSIMVVTGWILAGWKERREPRNVRPNAFVKQYRQSPPMSTRLTSAESPARDMPKLACVKFSAIPL